jgi:hypothetical protein
MKEEQPREEINFPEHLDYEEGSAPFGQLNWDSQLVTGTVIRLSHSLNDRIYVFECTGIKGVRRTEGFLRIHDEGLDMPAPRQAATISIVHRSPVMAQQNAPWIEFGIAGEESSLTILPAYTFAERCFSSDLAEWASTQAQTPNRES